MESALNILMVACLGAAISKLCGSKSILPLGCEQFLYAIPYFMILGLPYGIPAYAVAVYGKRMGHGQYIFLGRGARKPELDEVIEPILRLFFGQDNGGAYWRCVMGLAITGIAVTAMAGIIYALKIDALVGLFLCVSGASKAIAYMIGHKLKDMKLYNKPTEIGEYLTGFFGWGAACLVFLSTHG